MSNEKEKVALKLTSGAVIDGEIRTPGYQFETTEREAKKYLHRGKAVLDTKQPDAGDDEKALSDHTVKELKAILDDYGVKYDDKANKAALIELVEAHEKSLNEEGE